MVCEVVKHGTILAVLLRVRGFESHPLSTKFFLAPLAQLAEHGAYNAGVAGSILAWSFMIISAMV